MTSSPVPQQFPEPELQFPLPAELQQLAVTAELEQTLNFLDGCYYLTLLSCSNLLHVTEPKLPLASLELLQKSPDSLSFSNLLRFIQPASRPAAL